MDVLTNLCLSYDERRFLRGFTVFLAAPTGEHSVSLTEICLSENKDNLLMWAHYSESHSGFTMTFDLSRDIPFFAITFRVHYTSQYPVLKFLEEPQKAVVREILVKSNHWSYEQEFRIIKFENGLQSFNPAALTQVSMGLRITPENEEKIKKWLDAPQYKHVALYRAVKRKLEYGISFERV